MAKNNGGAAFPVPHSNNASGMTLRDYIAIHASASDVLDFRFADHDNALSAVAARYAFADAMIAEGAK